MMTCCLALVLAVVAQDDKEAEKAAADALDLFQKAYKGTEEERKTAIDELAKTQHPKVASKLGAILAGVTPSPVRVAAARALGGFAENKKQATTALSNALPANVKEPGVLSQIFESIGKLQDPSAVPLLARFYEDKELTLALNAVFTTGRVGSPSGIEPLIGILTRYEKAAAKPAGASIGVAASGTNPNLPGGVVVSGSNSNAQRDRAITLVSAANQALQDITKEHLSTADAWNAWWTKNKATFKKQP
jgi:HEAT repeat protein